MWTGTNKNNPVFISNKEKKKCVVGVISRKKSMLDLKNVISGINILISITTGRTYSVLPESNSIGYYSAVPCPFYCYVSVDFPYTSLRWLDRVFQGQYLPSLSVNCVAINKDLEKLTPQLY